MMKSPDSPLIVYESLMDSLIRDMHSGTTGFTAFHRDKFFNKDLSSVSRRIRNEGLHFLTVVLPSLGKAIDRALETKVINVPTQFALRRGTNLPKLFFGQFMTIFHSDGTLLDEPDVYSLQELRQVCFFFYKMELPFSEEQEEKSLLNFTKCEKDLVSSSFGKCDPKIVTRAQHLLSRLFSGYDPRDILPRHGPGSVNTGEKGNEKWSFKRLYNSIHQYYPYYDYFVSNRSEEILDRVHWYKGLERVDRPRSKVCLVPKDSRGPRVISVEPLEVQYIQQGQMRSLVRLISRHPLTKGFVNFDDQSINAKLALESSLTREYATLDLKEASDRVHCNLVRILFPTEITEYLFATRSEGTVLPNGEYLEFRKFAPMGSANCFPVLALTIWALIRAYFDVNGIRGHVYVYGDDVIVPTSTSAGVSVLLETFALKVNTDKSYAEGFFRESCGVDAYKGIDITPLRLRKPWSRKSTDYTLYAHLTSLMGRMYHRGFWRTSSTIQVLCSKMFGRIPYGTERAGFPCITVGCPILAHRLNVMSGVRFRWVERYQRYEYRVRTDKSALSKSQIDGWPRLLKALLSGARRDPSVVAFRQERILAWRWVAI